MAPLPKRKYAKSRQGQRRSHQHFSAPSIEFCPQCHSPKRCHYVCPTCGKYSGKEVIEVSPRG